MSNELDILKRRLEREIQSRKSAETILESKALQLYEANVALKRLNENLEIEVEKRSNEIIENEKKYRHLIENASDIIFNVSHEGFFTYMNPKGFEIFGYSENDVIGKHFLEFIRKDYLEDSKDVFDLLISGNEDSMYKQVPILTKNRKTKWIGQNINKIINLDGTYYFSSVARDITERIETQHELEHTRKTLERSELKYRGIMENMELGLMEVDNEGTIIKTYDRFNTMMGYEKGELIGKKANDVFLIKGEEGSIHEQQEARSRGETGVYEMKILKKDKSPIWVLISGAPFYDENDNVLGSIGIHYDITERKELQFMLERAQKEAENAQQAEKQFLASMSHEIRTPLNAIIGMNHLLKETELNSEQREYSNVMVSSAKLLKHLIADILDLSKIDSGLLEPHYSEFDIENLLEESLKMFSFKFSENEVEFISDVNLELTHLVKSDPQFLNQVLVNLLGNAEKFTEKGKIILGAKTLEEKPESYRIKFWVKDTGIGIEKENLQKIFNRFTQETSEIRTKYGGTGLGLPICREMLEILGSDIKVTSALGQGSEFYFELDLKKGSPIHEKEQNHASSSAHKIYKGKVLVAEDNQMNCMYIESLLKRWKIEYDIVHNGVDAVNSNENHGYDLILMDLQMPEMDGFEATQKIILHNKEKEKNAKVVALTASSFMSNKKKALEIGMIDFLTKPFSPDQLMNILAKYLNSQQVEILGEKTDTFNYLEGLNHDTLLESYGEDLEHAKDMFEVFLENIESYISELNQALQCSSLKDSKTSIHKINPIFTMVGLDSITQDLSDLEEVCDAIGIEELTARWNEIESEVKSRLPLLEKQLHLLKSHLKL